MVDLIRKDATSTVGGELTNGAQTIAGAKTFTGATTFSGALTPSGGLVGRTSGVAVPAGQIGETIQSLISVAVPATTASHKNITSISLTAGVWRITFGTLCDGNGASTWVNTNIITTLSTVSGSTTGTTLGTTQLYNPAPPVNNLVNSTSGSSVVNLSGSQQYFLNCWTSFTGSVPQLYGNIVATRIA